MSKKRIYKNLRTLTNRLRKDFEPKPVQGGRPKNPPTLLLLYAYNRTGKTRLSMEFRDVGKQANNGNADTLYFNAFTEDLFQWDNDLEHNTTRFLKLNPDSKFFDGLKDLALDVRIAYYLARYADFGFDIDYDNWTVVFSKGDSENIKISRGEENIFIWCLFMALWERIIDGLVSYSWAKYIYIDDPISSLDDNNAIAVACDLAKLLRKAANKKDGNNQPAPLKVVFSTHHALFYNVMFNDLSRNKKDEGKVKYFPYYLHRSDQNAYVLLDTSDAPYFHHVASLTELVRAANKGKLYTFHFNALRSIMEKTASFFGNSDISFCLGALNNPENEATYDRLLNIFSHGKYSLFDPTEMGPDNQKLFREILSQFTLEFRFRVPEVILPEETVSSS